MKSNKQPNIIIIYADDLGFGDLNCYGATDIPTPHLDKMASEGCLFENAYATAATCTPSRYSLITGSYPWKNPKAKILKGDAPMLIDESEATLPKSLLKSGYNTAVIGKWHLGLGNEEKPIDWNQPIYPSPLDVGFNKSYVMAATNDRVPCVYVNDRLVENLDPDDPIEVSYSKENPFPEIPTGKANPELLKTFHSDAQHFDTIVNGVGRIGFSRGGKTAQWDDQTMSDVFLNKSKEFIEENKETPFFLYYALHQPHVPRIPSKRFEGYTNKGPRGDVIAELDWCVGEILDHLKKHELDKNTLVVFSSDNGPVLDDGYKDMSVEKCGAHKPAGPLRGGKYSMFDGGSRVPMITYCPNLVKKGKNNALFSHVDFFASLSSLCEYPYDAANELDSIDLLDVLLGKSEKGRDHLVTEGIGAKTVIRWKNWIYIPPYDGPKIFADKNIETGNSDLDQLYNLENDIGQMTNIADKHPEIVKDLKDLLNSIQKNSQSPNNTQSNVSDI